MSHEWENSEVVHDDLIELMEFAQMCEKDEQPYSGETKRPVTLIDLIAYRAIQLCGNDNKPREYSPYVPFAKREQLDPSSRKSGAYGERLFGEDFMTRHFNLLGGLMTCVYNKKYGNGRVYFDSFYSRGGLASRTSFKAHHEKPNEIIKSRQTQFYLKHLEHATFIDFARQLSRKEKRNFERIMKAPEGILPTDMVLLGELVGETFKEAKLREKNTLERDDRLEEHAEELAEIARCRIA
jgi:hypothetical protein